MPKSAAIWRSEVKSNCRYRFLNNQTTRRCRRSRRPVVIVHVRCKDVAQMALVEDDDLIQALATNRTDHALEVRVLPRGAWCREDLSYSHRRHPLAADRV